MDPCSGQNAKNFLGLFVLNLFHYKAARDSNEGAYEVTALVLLSTKDFSHPVWQSVNYVIDWL